MSTFPALDCDVTLAQKIIEFKNLSVQEKSTDAAFHEKEEKYKNIIYSLLKTNIRLRNNLPKETDPQSAEDPEIAIQLQKLSDDALVKTRDMHEIYKPLIETLSSDKLQLREAKQKLTEENVKLAKAARKLKRKVVCFRRMCFEANRLKRRLSSKLDSNPRKVVRDEL